jgi:hypothetical protein
MKTMKTRAEVHKKSTTRINAPGENLGSLLVVRPIIHTKSSLTTASATAAVSSW